MSPLVRADCKIVQTSLHAREGDPAYTARAVFEVLEVAGEITDELVIGAETAGGGETITAAHWSADGGRTWTRTDGWSAGMYYTLRLMETSDGSVFASNGSSTAGKLGEIWKSEDRGRSWRRVFQHPTERYVWALCEADNGNLVAGTATTGHFYLSTDRGESWAFTDQTAAARYIKNIVKAANNDLIAGVGRFSAQGEIYRSQDNGVNWAFVQSFLPTTGGYIEGMIRLLDDTLLAGTSYSSAQIWRSADNGATWAKISTLPGQAYCYTLTQDADGVVYAASTYSRYVWRSFDGGFTWDYKEVGIGGSSVYTVAVLSNGDLLAGSSTGGKVRKSEDKGLTWTDVYSKIKIDTGVREILVLSQAQT